MTSAQRSPQLSKDFASSEFTCPCCGKDKVSPVLISLLQQLRDDVGEPIHVTSGFRCNKYNKSIGGFKGSPHTKGKAADIYCKKMGIVDLAARADLIFSRIGIYLDNNFIHVDIFPANPSKFWVEHKGFFKYFRPPNNHFDDVFYYISKIIQK